MTDPRHSQTAPRRSLRLSRPRAADAAALRRLAYRLGEDPDAQAALAPVAPAAEPQRLRMEALSLDPEQRAAAALSKCEGLLAGRNAGRRLLTMAEAVACAEDAETLEEALLRASDGEAPGCEGDRCPHRAAGYRDGLAPFAPQVRERIDLHRGDDRRSRLLVALRELLADEIEDRRQAGASAGEAAALLTERLDLLGDLPVTAEDLASIGRSIAEEAAPDPELAQALAAAADRIASERAQGAVS